MKRLLLSLLLILATSIAYSQDTLNTRQEPVDSSIRPPVAKSFLMDFTQIVPKWIEPEKEIPIKTEELSESDVKSIEADVKFLDELPKSYTSLPKEDLKKAIEKIDQKIAELSQQRDALLKEKVINQKLVDAKENTINSLNKEKNIIGLTIESGDLKDTNGNLNTQNSTLKKLEGELKTYLYTAIVIVAILILIIAVIFQRKRIKVQDVEIDKQLQDINKKNNYLEHAARIIRHDMHSGINTYMPRGLSSLEKRINEDKAKELKIDGSIKMIKEGLNHTQRVYKSVYEFTNLVKQNVVLDLKEVDIKDIISEYIKGTAYTNQVQIDNLMVANVNPSLFCTAVDNLIRNGLHFNDNEKKEVRIYLEEGSIVVEDNGRGLSTSQFEKIRRNENEKGLGLNIAIAIIEEHGFELFCEKIETGTKMKIKLK